MNSIKTYGYLNSTIYGEIHLTWGGTGRPTMRLEKVREWLSRYSSAFEHLTTESRKFVKWNVGDALGQCLRDRANVGVRDPGRTLPIKCCCPKSLRNRWT